MNKKLLRITIALVSLGALVLGLINIIPGIEKYFPKGAMLHIGLDNQFRFLAGSFIGYALVGFYIAKNIDTAIWPLRLLCFGIFIGGLGRLISLLTVGTPPTVLYYSMAVELLFPLFIVWQNSILNPKES